MPTFIHELPLVVTPRDERVLHVRLHAVRQVYNATLGEGLRRMDRLRESKAWRDARRQSRGKQRNEALIALRNEVGLSDYDPWKAIEAHLHGKRGRPRFKSARRFHSVEGKSNAAGIRFREGRVAWKGLMIPVRIDHKDKHGVEAHALSCKVKYVRLVRRTVNKRSRWFAQLIVEGSPWQKPGNPVAHGQEVGLDIGPSTLAAVGEDDAFLTRFCDEVAPLGREIRRIQRAMDRSRRATNPDNYHPDGAVKKGPKRWVNSKRYLALRAELAERQRRLAQTRKHAHGRMANRVLALGDLVKMESLSYMGFQKNFGKSARDRAPGMFVERLRRKAANAGGWTEEFPTGPTKLSQTCVCATVRKKRLSVRWHHCECGVSAQRDLFSAFLARHVEKCRLSIPRAQAAWGGAEPLLGRAMERLEQTASGSGSVPASFGLPEYRRWSRSSAKGESAVIEAGDAVGARLRSPRAPERWQPCP